MWWFGRPIDSFDFDCLCHLEWPTRCFVCVVERQVKDLKPMAIQPAAVVDALGWRVAKPSP